MKRIAFVTIVAVCMLLSQSACADSNLGLKGVGATVGVVDPDNVDATVGFGLLANWGQITPDIRLEQRLDYWAKSVDFYDGSEISFRDISMSGRGKYFFHVSRRNIRPFAGAGLGLHFVRAEVSVPDMDFGGTIVPGFTVSDSETKLGIDLGGGMETSLNPRLDFLAEVWYGAVSDLDQFSIKVGLIRKLGSR